MKRRTCLASSVVGTDRFLGMTPSAQALYLALNLEADVSGHVVGVNRVARGTGLGSEALNELYSEGYVLDVEGEAYLTHQWLNNKYDSREFAKMDECEPYGQGVLRFVGELGKSAYRLASTEERRLIDGEPSRNVIQHETTSTKLEANQGQHDGNSKEKAPCELKPCPQCRQPVLYGDTPEGVVFDCPSCGLVLVNPDGEVVE